MKQIIRLTESDLRNMVNEVMDELDYKTYKSAHDKMMDRGQNSRAFHLQQGVNQVYGQNGGYGDKWSNDPDSDNVEFDLRNDTMRMGNNVGQNGIFTQNPDETNNDSEDPTNPNTIPVNNTTRLRTPHRNVANNRAKKLDWFRGGAPKDGHRSVDDFISEAVKRVFNELAKKGSKK